MVQSSIPGLLMPGEAVYNFLVPFAAGTAHPPKQHVRMNTGLCRL